MSVRNPVGMRERRRARSTLLKYLRLGPLPSPDLVRCLRRDRLDAGPWLRRLAQEGTIVEFPLKLSGRWVSLYALPEHAEQAALLSGYAPLSQGAEVEREVEAGVSVPLLVSQ